MKVTMCWTDPDVTKTWLSETWTNGESKDVLASFYALDTSGGTVTEFWQASTTTDQFLFIDSRASFPVGFAYFLFRMSSSNYRLRLTARTSAGATTSTNAITTSMATIIDPSDLLPIEGYIGQGKFNHSITTSGGITIKWEPLSGSGGEAWEAASLSYGTRYGNNDCP
jgi:hypothetical protein